MKKPDPLWRYRANLQGEVDGAVVYRALAESESDPKLAEVFRRLASVEEAHGEFWRGRMGAKGDKLLLGPSLRARILAWLARRFGPGFVIPTLAAAESRDSAAYDDQADARGAGLPADERSHARIMRAVAGQGGLAGPTLAMLEGRHRGGGNTLRAAVLGGNDGLVSNVSLVMGVAGAAAAERTLLLAGLAGLVAGACSMAMGEWLSVTSSRELNQKQIATEADELREVPEEEKEELVLIYRAKGIEENQARALADRLLSNKETALDTLTREELGIDPDELGGSAWQAAMWSFVLFAGGAIVPVAPFIFLSGKPAFITSVAASGLALMAVGVGTSLFTGRSAPFSALRQLAIGLAAAAITYGVGAVVGVSMS
ncbi:MAG: VIT1/CCC1 transporter family protein [Alphaproteobacteria bacterium]|nr:VIT1/CCC1 transporter family protein [Alphaproteobacteria bacterium]